MYFFKKNPSQEKMQRSSSILCKYCWLKEKEKFLARINYFFAKMASNIGLSCSKCQDIRSQHNTFQSDLQSNFQLITNMTIKDNNESTHSKPEKSKSQLSLKNLQLNYLVSYKTHKKSHNIHCKCLKGLIAMFIIIFLNH